MCILHGKEEGLVLRCCIAGNNEDKRKERRGRFEKKRNIAMLHVFLTFRGMREEREHSKSTGSFAAGRKSKAGGFLI